MKKRIVLYALPGALIFLLGGCTNNEVDPGELLTVDMMESPARAGSGEPNLFIGDDGGIYLTWIEHADRNLSSLRFAAVEQGRWSQPRTITEGENWFVNWADFPSLIAFSDGSLAAHWLEKNGKDSYAYGVKIVQSTDGGNNWSDPVSPHRDGTQTEHGFVSLLPWSDDRLFAAWLDGRNFAKENGEQSPPTNEMSLRYALVDKNGRLYDEGLFDQRVCECCQTSAVLTTSGALVVYRDRSEKEIRDISVVRFRDGRWSEPSTLYNDGWEIKGCPVNGPSVASIGQDVAIAWFTGVYGTPSVKVIFSHDEGGSFGKPVTVDDGNPVGRVDVVMLPDGAALVSWMEQTLEGAEIRVRRINDGGKRDPSITISKTSEGRASGFFRMARKNNEIYFAWTQPGRPSNVLTAKAHLNGY